MAIVSLANCSYDIASLQLGWPTCYHLPVVQQTYYTHVNAAVWLLVGPFGIVLDSFTLKDGSVLKDEEWAIFLVL